MCHIYLQYLSTYGIRTDREQVGATLGLLTDRRRRVGRLRHVDAQLLLACTGSGGYRGGVIAQTASSITGLSYCTEETKRKHESNLLSKPTNHTVQAVESVQHKEHKPHGTTILRCSNGLREIGHKELLLAFSLFVCIVIHVYSYTVWNVQSLDLWDFQSPTHCQCSKQNYTPNVMNYRGKFTEAAHEIFWQQNIINRQCEPSVALLFLCICFSMK